MTHIYRGEQIEPVIRALMLNPAVRVPLFELVYHDCVQSYWYWGDSNGCMPELMPRRDAFLSLYGEAPLCSFSVTDFDSLIADMAKSYARVMPIANACVNRRMLSFDYLTPDKTVQKNYF